jgi:hypothetical protein
MKVKVIREHYVPKLDRRIDAIVSLSTVDMGYVALVECVHEEKEAYLRDKVRSFRQYPDLKDYIGRLIGFKVPFIDILIVRAGESICEKLPPLP